MIKSILIILIIYFTIRILYTNLKREDFQTATTILVSPNTNINPTKVEVLNSGLLVGDNNITTIDQNFYFPKGDKSLWYKKNSTLKEDTVNTLNSKRLCIREGNDIECIDAHELVNALSLKDYRKNSVCIDEKCLTKNTLDVLKSLTPSRHDKDYLHNKNKLKLKHGANKCMGSGLVNAHTCATQSNRLKVTRTDVPPCTNWQCGTTGGWGQGLVVKGNKCISHYATQESNPGSACIEENINVGSQHHGPAYVDLPLGTYWKFPPGNGNKGVNWQHPGWPDTFRLEVKSGQHVGGDSLSLNSMNLIGCNNNAFIKLEEGRDSSKVFTALGLVNDDYSGSGSGQSQGDSHLGH